MYLQIGVFVIAREGEPAARQDLGDAEEQAHAAEGEEQHVPELPPLPDPQAEPDLDRAAAGADRRLEEPEPEVLVLLALVVVVVEEAATGRLHGVRGRAPQPVAPRRARGADLELDLAARAALERAGPARHGAPAGGHAGAVQALVVVVQVVSSSSAAAASGAGCPGTGCPAVAVHGLVPHVDAEQGCLRGQPTPEVAVAFPSFPEPTWSRHLWQN